MSCFADADKGGNLMEKLSKYLKQRANVICGKWTRMAIHKKNLSGITVIELVLILVIVIALLLIFKNQLINLINTIFDKVVSESSGI